MPDTTGRIRAKALDTTGITEAMLEHDWAGGAGRTRMAVVELRTVEPHGPNLDGKKRIDYVVESIEPVPAEHEDTVRRFQRGLYLARPDNEGQATLKGTAGENADELAAAAADLNAAVEVGEDGEVKGVWDGSTEGPLTDPCPHPDCILPAEHDGDHEPEVQQPAEDPAES